MKKRLKKKIEWKTRAHLGTQVALKLSDEDMARITDGAFEYSAGNKSDFIRWCISEHSKVLESRKGEYRDVVGTSSETK